MKETHNSETSCTTPMAQLAWQFLWSPLCRNWSRMFLSCTLAAAFLPTLAGAADKDPVQAQSEPAPEAPVIAPEEPAVNSAGEKIRGVLERLRQPGDDAAPTELETDLSPDAKNQRKSLALYMAGRNYEHQKKYKEAYAAYQEAVQLDPNAINLYRAMIPLAFRLDKTQEAISLARKAVELDPDNFELLSQLGIYALRQQDLQGSIEYFQKAVDSQTVDKKSGPYISIMSQLGQLYLSLGNSEKAAEAYEVVFEALIHPEDFGLDFRTQQALESLRGSKSETYESLGELFLITNRLELAETAFAKAKDVSRGNPAVFSYQQARVLAKQKKHAEALKKLQEYFTAELSNKGRGPYLLLSELLVALDRQKEILTELEKLAEADPDNEALHVFLADQYIAADRLDEAEKIYQKYLSDKENQGDIQLGLLQIYRKRKNVDQVLETLTQAMLNGANSERLEAELELLAQDQELADAVIAAGQESDSEGDQREVFSQAYLLAKLAMQRKNYDAVIDFYQRAMEIRKERQILLTLYSELIQFLVAEEQYELCRDVLEEAIDNPALTATRQAFQLQLIRVLAQNKQPEEALKVIATARESDPDNLLWAYQEGWVYYTAENWEEAVKHFAPVLEKAITQKNETIEREVRYNLSRSLAFAGLSEEAVKLMEQSIEQQPDELLWQFQKGWIYYYSHQWEKAIEAYQALIENNPEANNQVLIRQAHFSLSAAYVQNEQFDEGEKILEKIYEKDPEDTSVCNDLGYLYADRGKNLNQAYEMIKKALDAEPENHAYLDSMGWVLYRLERYDEAVKYLEKAIEGSEKGDAVLWDHLGDCYNQLGQKEKARSAWEKALQHEQAEKFSNEKLIGQLKEKLK